MSVSKAGLAGKRVVVVGASQGVGREIVTAAQAQGAHVLAVARKPLPLSELEADLPGIATLSIDATDENAAEQVFEALAPEVLILCGGAHPVMAPVQDQTWEQFSVNWNADVKASFAFCKAALQRPLAPGSTVLLISSGAGLAGSHLSGSYAGAKRMQMFLAEYCQKQSDRLNLGIRFLALVPMRIMPDTGLGKVAVSGYSGYLGVSASEFIQGMEGAQTPEQVAEAVFQLVGEPPHRDGSIFSVSSTGIEAIL